MAIDKSQKPANLVPRSFGGEKNNFSDDLIASGFEPNTPETYNGDNLNYQLDATGKELDYCEKVVDYINGLGVGKTPIVNANNKLDETQVGLKVYSATETFGLGEWVKGTVNDVVGLYESLKPVNVGNDLTNETYWKKVELGGGGGEGGWKPSLFQIFWSDHLLNRVDMLMSNTFSWQSGEVYKACYDLLVSEYSTTSNTVTVDDVTFKITSNGYRIADATQEQAIMNLYDNTGVAWYYILDTTNTRFKLPRMKYLVSVKGAAQAPVMPYDSEQATLKASDYASKLTYFAHTDGQANGTILRNNLQGCLAIPLNKTQNPSALGASFGGNYGTWAGTFTPMMFADLANTGTPQTLDNMYLYFYVGEYTQTAVEQTAGLNAELFNVKMDRDLSNRTSNIHFVIETSDKSILPSWYRIYDDGWCEQGGYTSPSVADITFLKPFKDINFTVITQPTNKMITRGGASYQANFNYTTHGFTTIANINIDAYVWQASGYIK